MTGGRANWGDPLYACIQRRGKCQGVGVIWGGGGGGAHRNDEGGSGGPVGR